MAHARVVITNPNEHTPAVRGIFEGLRFFLLQRVPQRSTFIQRIQANGGRVVKTEEQADHIIADHMRHDCPNGSISYTFIDTAIKSGSLPDLEDHLAGAARGSARPVGSVSIPGKSTRTPYTPEDDRILWEWVERSKRNGASIKGNELYKELEAAHPRHTYQSWRDRYIKRIMHHPPAGVRLTVSANAPPSPPTAQDEEGEIVTAQAEDAAAERQDSEGQQTVPQDAESYEDDVETLLPEASDIENVPEENQDEAWEAFSKHYGKHSPETWRRIWHTQVRPEWLKRKRTADQDVKVEAQDNAVEANALDNETARPTSSHKRARSTPTATSSRTYSRKKQKTTSSDIFGSGDEEEVIERRKPYKATQQDPSDVRTQASRGDVDAAKLAPTATTLARKDTNAAEPDDVDKAPIEKQVDPPLDGSERSEADLVGTQWRRLETRQLDVPVLPTSEADRAAEEQLREDVLGPTVVQRNGTGEPSQQRMHSNVSTLLTSDANRAAEEQLRQESFGSDPAAEQQESDDHNFASPTYPKLPAAEEEEVVAVRSAPSEVAPLSEANLALQQAEHQARVHRGMDIPPDIEGTHTDQKLEQMAKFIRDLYGKNNVKIPDPLVTMQDAVQLPGAGSADRRSVEATEVFAEQNDEMDGVVPLASQQQLFEATADGMIDWPMSSSPDLPARTAFVEPAQGVNGMMSQVEYPALPPRHDGDEAFPDLAPSQDEVDQAVPHVNQQHESSIAGKDDDTELPVSLPTAHAPRHPALSNLQGGQRHSYQESEESSLVARSIEQDAEKKIHAASETRPVDTPSTPSSSLIEEAEPEDHEDQTTPTAPCALETQDIVNAETQHPDFDMPPPDDDAASDALFWDPFKRFSSPPLDQKEPDPTPSTQQNLTQPAIADDEVDTFITTMALRYNLPELSVLNALLCTSKRQDLAELVLLEEKAGKGLPKDVPGIWSKEEDKQLEGTDAKALRVLEGKHGWRECEERLMFLMAWREEDGQ